jgi:hypothetical protein
VALLIALTFFFGPLGAFVFGARPEAFENHPLAEMPSLSEGWSFFPAFTTWAVDHLPLRQHAVQSYATASERLFGQPPSYGSAGIGGPAAGDPGADDAGAADPLVIAGEDGWLYYADDVNFKCDPIRSIEETLGRIERLAAAVQNSGRRFVFTIAPDKSTFSPANLPDDYVGAGCATDRQAAFWTALEATPPTGYLDLRGPLEAEQQRSGSIYRALDTHWTPRGAAVYAQELAGRLDPALLEDTEIVATGDEQLPGDLSVLLGLNTEDDVDGVEVRRPGVTPVGRDGLILPVGTKTEPVTATNTTSDASLFEPDTLLLGDSFTMESRPALGTLFAQVSLLDNQSATVASPQVTADAIADADVVVFEVVERHIGSGRSAVIEDATLAAIEATLAQQPR